jgi:hypothetical protein
MNNHKAAVSTLRTLAKIERSVAIAAQPDPRQRDFTKALAFAELAATRARDADSPMLIREALTDLGDMLIEDGQPQLGAAAYREALAAAEHG